MKLTFKTLQQVTFSIEVDGTETISQVKQKIESEKGFPASTQKLIHSGKILSDDATVESCKITEKDFVVVMVSKPRASTTSAPAPAAPATSSTESKPATTSTPAAPVAPASTPASTTTAATSSFDASTLATGAAYESAVSNLIDMGFPREDVVRAMRAAFNNPDRAAEYLMTGIPDSVAREALPAAGAAPGSTPASATGSTPATTTSAPAPNQPLNLFEAAAAQAQGRNQPTAAAGGAAAGGLDLSALRNSQQFQQLRRLVATQPELLQPLLQQLAASNPQFMQLMTQNQDQFLQALLGDGADIGEGEGGAPGSGGAYITITPEEDAAIQRLTALGFERNLAIEAFLACDKNEELAANYLFDMAQGGEEWQ